MAYNAISSAQLIINNEVIFYKPNSIKVTSGLGEDKVQMASGGGGVVVPVHSRDVSTLKGKVSFDLFPTKESIAWVRAWKANRGSNAISTPDSVSGYRNSFSDMAVVNDPETSLSADGAMTVQFEGSPAL